MNFEEFSQKERSAFDQKLLSYITNESHTILEEAMLYSLDSEGKRWRPLLLLAVLKSFSIDLSLGYPAASALEMIHTYSLIHDDLPAMDNDALRRGKATNHIQYDEATAILAGDALLTLAFEVITTGELPAKEKLKLTQLLAETAGYKGMVGGQQADIEGEDTDLSLAEIEAIHRRKTGALIQMATVAGGIISGKNKDILQDLANFSEELGIAYQMRDDILDQVGSQEELGKAVQTDSALGKSTYPVLLGLPAAFEAFNERLSKAKAALEKIADQDPSFSPELLKSFIDQLSLEEYQ